MYMKLFLCSLRSATKPHPTRYDVIDGREELQPVGGVIIGGGGGGSRGPTPIGL